MRGCRPTGNQTEKIPDLSPGTHSPGEAEKRSKPLSDKNRCLPHKVPQRKQKAEKEDNGGTQVALAGTFVGALVGKASLRRGHLGWGPEEKKNQLCQHQGEEGARQSIKRGQES